MKKVKSILIVALTFAFIAPFAGALPALAAGAAVSFGVKKFKENVESYMPTAGAFELITPADLTFNGEELRDLREAIFEAQFSNPSPGDFHNIVPGIIALKQIGYIGRLGMVGKSGKGCDPADDANNIAMSEKFWDPKTVSVRLSACKGDLLESLFVYSMQKGVKRADVTTSEFFNMILDLFPVENLEALYRHAWFGDTAANTVDGSPAGTLTAGTDITFFNAVNGFWKQLGVIVAANTARLTTDLASRNGQASFADQEFTSTDTTNRVVTNCLQNMRYGADFRLRGEKNLVYVVTQSVADQYEKELTAANVAFTTERLENGMTLLKSGGIEVIGFNLWDRIIREFYSDGTVYYKPHRALLTTKNNCAIGLEMADSFNGLEVFYDKKSKRNYIDGDYTMDAKILRDEFVQLAW